MSPEMGDVKLGFTGHRHDDELGLIDMRNVGDCVPPVGAARSLDMPRRYHGARSLDVRSPSHLVSDAAPFRFVVRRGLS